MVWSTTLLVFGVLIVKTVGQTKYGPYKGPPVVPVILPGGFLADTKEVAAAKEYFLNALAKTAAEVKDDSTTNFYNTRSYQTPDLGYQQPTVSQYQRKPQQATPAFQPQLQRYTEPQRQSSLLYHLQAAYRPTSGKESPNYGGSEYREPVQYQYTNSSPRPDPQVTPVILENGYIADTPEVNATKANHFAAVAKAQQAVARAQERTNAVAYSSPQYSSGYQIVAPANLAQQSYSGY